MDQCRNKTIINFISTERERERFIWSIPNDLMAAKWIEKKMKPNTINENVYVKFIEEEELNAIYLFFLFSFYGRFFGRRIVLIVRPKVKSARNDKTNDLYWKLNANNRIRIILWFEWSWDGEIFRCQSTYRIYWLA